ncbi:hypothetical protein Tco_1185721 [Tanacetum coccineum]
MTPKRLKEDKDDEAKYDEPNKGSWKEKKNKARKGMHPSVDKNDSEDSDKVESMDVYMLSDRKYPLSAEDYKSLKAHSDPVNKDLQYTFQLYQLVFHA